MLVRHPMERLVSCYFDKMVNGTHKSLRGFRKFVKNKAQSIRRNRREQVNKKKGVYAPLPEDKIGKNKTKKYDGNFLGVMLRCPVFFLTENIFESGPMPTP